VVVTVKYLVELLYDHAQVPEGTKPVFPQDPTLHVTAVPAMLKYDLVPGKSNLNDSVVAMLTIVTVTVKFVSAFTILETKLVVDVKPALMEHQYFIKAIRHISKAIRINLLYLNSIF
jgi:hypothetical protein